MTEYELKDGKWNSSKPLTSAVQLAKRQKNMTFVECEKNSPRLGIREIFSKNQHLQIKFEDEIWYMPKGNSGTEASQIISEDNSEEQELSEIWKQQKIGSWIWFENKKSKQKILGGLDFSFRFDLSSELRPLQMLKNCFQAYFPGDKDLKFASQSKINNTQTTINKEKGKWISTEEVCGLANKRKWSVNEDQRKNLKLFCAKPKSEE